LALCGCLIGIGVGYSQTLYPKVVPVEPPIRQTTESVPTQDSALRVTTLLEEIPDGAAAARLCRAIMRAQARTAERQRKERGYDAI
jgi:hypothetical protein